MLEEIIMKICAIWNFFLKWILAWVKNDLIKSRFLRRVVGHWFMVWKVKWRAPGLRRKFGHKFTHFSIFTTDIPMTKKNKFEMLKELLMPCLKGKHLFVLSLYDTCGRSTNLFLENKRDCQSCLGALCGRIEFWQRSFRPGGLLEWIKWTRVFAKQKKYNRHILTRKCLFTPAFGVNSTEIAPCFWCG